MNRTRVVTGAALNDAYLAHIMQQSERISAMRRCYSQLPQQTSTMAENVTLPQPVITLAFLPV